MGSLVCFCWPSLPLDLFSVDFENIEVMGAESESESVSVSPGVVATSQESESESIKLPRLRLRNVLFEFVI